MRCKACNCYMDVVRDNKHGIEDLCSDCRISVKIAEFITVKEYQWESITDGMSRYRAVHPDTDE